MPDETEIAQHNPFDLSEIEIAFKDVYGIEPTRDDFTETVRSSMTETSSKLLDHLVAGGNLSEAERDSVIRIWDGAIFLDERAIDSFIEGNAKQYEDSIAILQGIDPELELPETKNAIAKLKLRAENIRSMKTHGLAFVISPSITAISENAPDSKLPRRFVVLNLGKQEELGTEEQRVSTAIEETCHLISKLKEYNYHTGFKFDKKWIEEMMARVIGINMGNEVNDVEVSEKIKAEMRYGEYIRLFYLINQKMEGDNPLLDMFLGKEQLDSPRIARLAKTIEEFDLFGEIVDAGVDLNVLANAIGGK